MKSFPSSARGILCAGVGLVPALFLASVASAQTPSPSLAPDASLREPTLQEPVPAKSAPADVDAAAREAGTSTDSEMPASTGTTDKSLISENPHPTRPPSSMPGSAARVPNSGGTEQLTTSDIDRDGRLSASEFSAYVGSQGAAAGVGLAGGVTGTGVISNGPPSPAASGTAGSGTATSGTTANGAAPWSDGLSSRPVPGPASAGVSSAAELFRKLDTNQDGFLDRAELGAYRGTPASSR